VLRRREPMLTHPYRTWGYPAVSVIFVTLAAALLMSAFFSSRAAAFFCLALIASGITLYVTHRWRSSKIRPNAA
jgi:amino acid transporter